MMKMTPWTRGILILFTATFLVCLTMAFATLGQRLKDGTLKIEVTQ